MKIKMLATVFGSDQHANGANLPPKQYEAGKTYDVGLSLARALCVDMKAAQPVLEFPEQEPNQEPPVPPPAPEGERSQGPAPENKDMGQALENKQEPKPKKKKGNA